LEVSYLQKLDSNVRRRSLARAREERIQYNKGLKNSGTDKNWSAWKEAETVTLMEPILSGRTGGKTFSLTYDMLK